MSSEAQVSVSNSQVHDERSSHLSLKARPFKPEEHTANSVSRSDLSTKSDQSAALEFSPGMKIGNLNLTLEDDPLKQIDPAIIDSSETKRLESNPYLNNCNSHPTVMNGMPSMPKPLTTFLNHASDLATFYATYIFTPQVQNQFLPLQHQQLQQPSNSGVQITYSQETQQSYPPRLQQPYSQKTQKSYSRGAQQFCHPRSLYQKVYIEKSGNQCHGHNQSYIPQSYRQKYFQTQSKDSKCHFRSHSTSKHNFNKHVPNYKVQNKQNIDLRHNRKKGTPRNPSHELKKTTPKLTKFHYKSPRTIAVEKLKVILPEEIKLKIGTPPLKPLSAYRIFLQDQYNIIKKENPEMKHSEIQKKANSIWLFKTSPLDKEAYEHKYMESLREYNKQLNEYHKNKKKVLTEYYQKLAQEGKGVDSSNQKIKFKTAFKLFKLDHVSQVKQKYPDASFKQRSDILKEMWKGLSQHSKFLYVKRSRLEMKK